MSSREDKKLIILKIAAVVVAVLFVFVAVLGTILSVKSCNDGKNPFIKRMEKLDRGLVAVKTQTGVTLSWRIFGNENLAEQAFDVYRNGNKIATTGKTDATFFVDESGTVNDRYCVVPENAPANAEKQVSVWNTNAVYTNDGNLNSVAYLDIKFAAPEGGTIDGQENGDYTYTANDASVGDVDGDGDYEIILKWDPSNSKDNAVSGYTGNVFIDAYDVDYSTGEAELLWRIDLGCNIRAGAHYTQFLVYDFDGNGKAEVVLKTAPGSKDGKGSFVTDKGISDDIKQTDNSVDLRNGSGRIMTGAEFLTVFDGLSGEALQTVYYNPSRDITDDWGDGKTPFNRVDRFLAAVAYLNGETPSIVTCRGYYTDAYVAAYNWDGENLHEVWFSASDKEKCVVTYPDGTQKSGFVTAYGQGNHNLAVADVDNDGKDEIVYGSAIIDEDGTILTSTGRGHGDAIHVSDYDNDGVQDIFQVHEEKNGTGVDLRHYDKSSGTTVDSAVLETYTADVGRGLIGNIDDGYAAANADARAMFWSSLDQNLYNLKGVASGKRPQTSSMPFYNFTVYWDGDLGVELLDRSIILKADHNGDTKRFYYSRTLGYFPEVGTNNSTKSMPCLCADILGDWREEIIYRLSDGSGIRIYFSTIPTEYRLYTLMHDGQYRTGVAAQNVGYNQPAHTSYYIGSVALKKDSDGSRLNYLEPKKPFDRIKT